MFQACNRFFFERLGILGVLPHSATITSQEWLSFLGDFTKKTLTYHCYWGSILTRTPNWNWISNLLNLRVIQIKTETSSNPLYETPYGRLWILGDSFMFSRCDLRVFKDSYPKNLQCELVGSEQKQHESRQPRNLRCFLSGKNHERSESEYSPLVYWKCSILLNCKSIMQL